LIPLFPANLRQVLRTAAQAVPDFLQTIHIKIEWVCPGLAGANTENFYENLDGESLLSVTVGEHAGIVTS
jgi:hypothetical protein